jgi:hypothetical protein
VLAIEGFGLKGGKKSKWPTHVGIEIIKIAKIIA